MFVLVPDTGGVVNGNRRSKSQVVTFANGTVAHEYQHMINAGPPAVCERRRARTSRSAWLDEGLAHIAEDINFWRAAGRSTRTNFDNERLRGSQGGCRVLDVRVEQLPAVPDLPRAPGDSVADRVRRVRRRSPDARRDLEFPQISSRDHQPVGQDNALWFKLVNSTTSGVANLTAALGAFAVPAAARLVDLRVPG